MKNKTWLVCIFLLAVLNIVLFWPGSLYFLNDDLLHIPLTDEGAFFQTNSVRPVHELLIKFDLWLWGKNSYGYHITALLLHFIVSLQVYFLCLVMQKKWLNIPHPQAVQSSLLAVFLFLVYPQSTESLAWIIGRGPVLSAVFLMFALHLFFADRFNWKIYIAGAVFFAASLFAYEQSALVPGALGYLAFAEKDKLKRRGMVRFVIGLLCMLVVYVAVRKVITKEVVGVYEGGNLLQMNLATLLANVCRIVFRLFLNHAFKVQFMVTAVIFMLVLGAILYRRRKIGANRDAVVFFAAIVLLLIAPAISLGVAVNSFESGRYLYLPSIFMIIGVSLAIGAGAQRGILRKYQVVLFAGFIIYWLSEKYTGATHYKNASVYAAHVQNKIQQHFKNTSDTLYLDTLNVTINRLPVFRMGLKTGINWLGKDIDTNKVVVKYYNDEVEPRTPQ